MIPCTERDTNRSETLNAIPTVLQLLWRSFDGSVLAFLLAMSGIANAYALGVNRPFTKFTVWAVPFTPDTVCTMVATAQLVCITARFLRSLHERYTQPLKVQKAS